jgi:hypothetical protein
MISFLATLSSLSRVHSAAETPLQQNEAMFVEARCVLASEFCCSHRLILA